METPGDRLSHFLAAEGITQSRLADILGVTKANISHIISGRNKPGYEFISKLPHYFPTLNLEWLLAGSGKMYKDTAATLPQETAPESAPDPEPDTAVVQKKKENRQDSDDEYKDTVFDSQNVPSPAPKTVSQASERRILKVIALYDDGTYGEL